MKHLPSHPARAATLALGVFAALALTGCDNKVDTPRFAPGVQPVAVAPAVSHAEFRSLLVATDEAH